MFGELSGTHRTIPALVSGQAIASLASGYNFQGQSAGVFTDCGFSIALPSAGTYLIGYNVRSSVTATGSVVNFILAELYRDDIGAAVPNSQRMCSFSTVAGQNVQGNYGFTHIVTVVSACNIHVYVAWGGTAVTVASCYSDANGWMTMNYVKIS